MVKLNEVKGNYIVFTLADGTTLRLLPFAEATIKKELVSDNVRDAVVLGYVHLTEITSTPKTKGGAK